MGEILTIPARDLATTYDDVALFRDVERGSLHPNMQRVYDAAHGGPLTFSPGGSGSENQKQGDEAAALFNLRVALDRGSGARGITVETMLDAVAPAYHHTVRERMDGQCRKEVLSPNYWHLSAMFRALALREAVGLLAHPPADIPLLRTLAAELVVWFRIHRHLIRRFQAYDGLVWHPGIRDKSDPDENEQPNILADLWERPVTHPRVRKMLDELQEGKPQRVARRGHEAMAMRIYESDFGRWLEAVTRRTVPGRLTAEVGWTGDLEGRFLAIMPQIQAIHTSPLRGGRGNKPTLVTFEVDARSPGRPEMVEFEGHVAPGEWVRHPHGREIPDGWEVFGPDTLLPEVPEVLVENGTITDPATPAKPSKPAPPPRSEPGAPNDARRELEALRAGLAAEIAWLRTSAANEWRGARKLAQAAADRLERL